MASFCATTFVTWTFGTASEGASLADDTSSLPHEARKPRLRQSAIAFATFIVHPRSGRLQSSAVQRSGFLDLRDRAKANGWRPSLELTRISKARSTDL